MRSLLKLSEISDEVMYVNSPHGEYVAKEKKEGCNFDLIFKHVILGNRK